jgi:hypothetical protein
LRDVVEALLRAWAVVNEVAVTTSFHLAGLFSSRYEKRYARALLKLRALT